MALGQGLFYLASGLWPVLHLRSFEKVTGPKTDDWLVKTVGTLIAVTGAALTRAGISSGKPVAEELKWVAMGEALTLGGVSLIYSSRNRISKIYLLDTLTEAALIGGWLIANRIKKSATSRTRRVYPGQDNATRSRRYRLLRVVPPKA